MDGANQLFLDYNTSGFVEALLVYLRLTEIDYINGAIVRKGKAYGIATPYCQFLTELIHCKVSIITRADLLKHCLFI
jgi:hypothetical protein